MSPTPASAPVAAKSSVGGSAGIAGAMIAMMAWGASGVLAKSIDMAGLSVVVYRFWLSTIVFFGYLAIVGFRHPESSMTMAKLRLALPGGIGLALDVAFFFSAVKLTTVANATVMVALQPLVMMYLGSRFLAERVGLRQVVWSMVALVGVGLLIYGSSGLPEWSLKGDLLALGALLAWAAYLFFSKTTQGKLNPVEYTAATGLITAVVNTPLAILFGQSLAWPTTRSWLLLGSMTFGSGMCAHLLMNWSLTRIPVWLGSTMSLLIPPSAAIMAWLVLGERVTVLQAAGILLTLAALLAIMRSRRPEAEPAE